MKKSIKTAWRASVAALLLLAVVLCFTACGKSSTPKIESAEGSVEGMDLSWKYDQDEKKLTVKGSGEMKSFESSEAVAWSSVRLGVEKLVLEGVTTVGDYAFYYMPNLKEITWSEGITSIGSYAFGFCSSLETVEVPASVTTIGASAFEACTSLKSVVIHEGVTALGARAFALCASLNSATVLATVEEIGAETFYNCKALHTLILNPSVVRAHESAFVNANNKSLENAERRGTVDGGTYEVEIAYVLEEGGDAFPAVRETLQNGESKSYPTPTREGYTADRETVEITVNGAAVYEKVTYKKNAETEPAPEETAPEETTAAVEEPEESSTTELVVSVVLLAVVLIAMAVGAFFLFRSNKKNASKNGKGNQKNGKKK